MHVVVIIALSIVGIIASLFIIALFVPKSYSLQEEIIVNKPRQIVFDFISHLRNQQQFNKWVMADPNLKMTFAGNDGTEGFALRWESQDKKVGTGEQYIDKIENGKRIDYSVTFIEPFEGEATAFIQTQDVSSSSTNVAWNFSSSMKYPMNIMILFGITEMLRKDLAKSLINLKILLEK